MKKKRIQVILKEDDAKRFEQQREKQGRTESGLARFYIVKGLTKDEGDKK